MDQDKPIGLLEMLKAGKLPEVSVSLSERSLFSMLGGIFLVGACLILAQKIIKEV